MYVNIWKHIIHTNHFLWNNIQKPTSTKQFQIKHNYVQNWLNWVRFMWSDDCGGQFMLCVVRMLFFTGCVCFGVATKILRVYFVENRLKGQFETEKNIFRPLCGFAKSAHAFGLEIKPEGVGGINWKRKWNKVFGTHRRSQSHAVSAKRRKRSPPVDRWITHVCRIRTTRVLRAINADRYFASGRTQFLIQTPVCTYPHVVFGDLHLRIQSREIL